MCVTGRCTEGTRYRVGIDDDRYHDDLTKHYDIALRNAAKTQDFFETHKDCEVCSFIRTGF
ncbi:hypothetical protein RGQ21_67590 [Kitasatospora aureofaciens]|nr:hypothetical protein RGQ21_67590 [Kitasatospora aureofaciens]